MLHFFKIKGVKKPQNEYTDPDADYNEDEENLLDSIPEDVNEIIREDEDEETYESDDVTDEEEE